MQADVSGPQRKVIGSSVRPAKRSLGDSGIPIRGGRTLPFRVQRDWNAPAGVYLERFYLIDPRSREVLYEGPEREEQIWGLQSLTTFVDEVIEGFPLRPGPYALVFALGGVLGAEVPVEAFEVSAEEAA